MAGNQTDSWNKAFYVLGTLVFTIGVVNLLLLKEYPSMVGLEIKERGQLLKPNLQQNETQQ